MYQILNLRLSTWWSKATATPPSAKPTHLDDAEPLRGTQDAGDLHHLARATGEIDVLEQVGGARACPSCDHSAIYIDLGVFTVSVTGHGDGDAFNTRQFTRVASDGHGFLSFRGEVTSFQGAVFFSRLVSTDPVLRFPDNSRLAVPLTAQTSRDVLSHERELMAYVAVLAAKALDGFWLPLSALTSFFFQDRAGLPRGCHTPMMITIEACMLKATTRKKIRTIATCVPRRQESSRKTNLTRTTCPLLRQQGLPRRSSALWCPCTWLSRRSHMDVGGVICFCVLGMGN